MISAGLAFATLSIFDLRAPDRAKRTEAAILSLMSAMQIGAELWHVSLFSLLIVSLLAIALAAQVVAWPK